MDPYQGCLAHLNAAQRDAYLAHLAPGSSLDHRGTELDGQLLARLLDAVRDLDTQLPKVGPSSFTEATFMDVADFSAATFTGYAWFTSAKFHAKALFGSVTFTGPASFESATFNEDALFESVTFTHAAVFDSAAFTHAALFDSTTFNEGALFDSVTFTHAATFESATFNCPATFESATFTGPATFRAAQFNDVAVFESASFSRAVSFSLAEFNSGVSFESVTTSTVADFSSATFNSYGWFQSATFNNSASFQDAVFEELAQMGPLACTGTLDLSFAKFKAPVTIEAAAQSVVCYRTHWSSTASLRLRHARVDFTDAIFESPFSVVAHPAPSRCPIGNLWGRPSWQACQPYRCCPFREWTQRTWSSPISI